MCPGMTRNVKAREPPPPSACRRVSVCFSCVSIDARRAEGGDGAVAGRYASGRSSVSLLPQEASKSGLVKTE